MSAAIFQLIDEERTDNSIIKRDYIKLDHQRGAQVDDENQIIKIFFVENLNYMHMRNGYLDFDEKIRKADKTHFIVSKDVNTNELD